MSSIDIHFTPIQIYQKQILKLNEHPEYLGISSLDEIQMPFKMVHFDMKNVKSILQMLNLKLTHNPYLCLQVSIQEKYVFISGYH